MCSQYWEPPHCTIVLSVAQLPPEPTVSHLAQKGHIWEDRSESDSLQNNSPISVECVTITKHLHKPIFIWFSQEQWGADILSIILLSELRKEAQGQDWNPEDHTHKPRAQRSRCWKGEICEAPARAPEGVWRPECLDLTVGS